jgi:hypothetical protein
VRIHANPPPAVVSAVVLRADRTIGRAASARADSVGFVVDKPAFGFSPSLDFSLVRCHPATLHALVSSGHCCGTRTTEINIEHGHVDRSLNVRSLTKLQEMKSEQ